MPLLKYASTQAASADSVGCACIMDARLIGMPPSEPAMVWTRRGSHACDTEAIRNRYCIYTVECVEGWQRGVWVVDLIIKL